MRVRKTARLKLAALALALVPALALACGHTPSEPAAEPPAAVPLTTVPGRDVSIEDAFWSPKQAVWRTVTVADCFTKFERDGAFTNFDKVRDGKGGTHGGPQWYDGLVYETITGAADLLAETPDPKLEQRIHAYIARIAAAADKDPAGYLNTHTQLKEPTHRWGTTGGDDREQHDLDNAACLVEAGVHYYRATGKAELLRVAARLANLMCDVMGPAPRQNIVPGHALGEATLVELWALFREQPDLKRRLPFAVDGGRYLALAQFWVDQRGRHAGRTSFGSYGQDDQPFAQQSTIEGHAVRATRFAGGLAALAPAAALRLEAALQPGWSVGILEWQVDGPDATIRVDTRSPGKPVSKYLAGACIEDVNHEIYGGLYSQMIFGESFQEPSPRTPAQGFAVSDGDWRLVKDEMYGGAGDGPKLVATDAPLLADGSAGVEVFLPATDAPSDGVRNAGLILRVAKPGAGADNFDGYEISLDAGRQVVGIGRHQHDYRLLQDVPCPVPTGRWVALSAKLTGGTIAVSVDGKAVATVTDPRPLPAGAVGLRQWRRTARYRNLWVEAAGHRTELPFVEAATAAAVSGMWRPTIIGTAVLRAELVPDAPFVGAQSQRITFAPGGSGAAGVENRGLNRRGLGFVAGKEYEGHLWLRAVTPAEVAVSLEAGDGKTLARATIQATGDGWRRYAFTLTPSVGEVAGRFAVRLTAPGSVDVGYAFLQPGDWGRFKGLPVRQDVVAGLIDQGVRVLRYGGSMVNAPAYKWKNMVGPRDRRPPYRGHWYPHSSNGWGIPDFLDLCDAAGFLAIPDFNSDETPADLADFVEYANGPADSPGCRKRAEAGHPAPYRLRHLQLGNEEKVDAAYAAKFERLVRAIWAKDPDIILVVGDFQYERPITDPAQVSGAASGVTALDGHKRILEFAKRAGREVWFDVHVWTDGPGLSPSAQALPSYIDALGRLANGAKHRVAVFEFNANNHDQRRALANAGLIGRLVRDGRVAVGLSANALQVDGQNDNGWDQGLLFFNSSKVWLQPPGYVTQMVERGLLPRTAEVAVAGAGGALEVTATRDADGKAVALQVVNAGARPVRARLRLDGLTPSKPAAAVAELAGRLDAKNTAENPAAIAPRRFAWPHGLPNGPADYTFPPHSFTVLRID